MPRFRQLSAYLVAFCLALAACGGDDADDDADPQPTTTSPETTQSQEEEDEAALRQLAEDWYEFVSEVYRETHSSDGAERYLEDPYLSEFQDSVAEYVATDNSTEESQDSGHSVLSINVDGDAATVEECIVDADVLRGPSGEIVNDSVLAQLVRTSATRTTEGWRFRERRLVSEQEGDTQCAG